MIHLSRFGSEEKRGVKKKKKQIEFADKVINSAWPEAQVIVYHPITSPLQGFQLKAVIAYEPIVQVEAAS